MDLWRADGGDLAQFLHTEGLCLVVLGGRNERGAGGATLHGSRADDTRLHAVALSLRREHVVVLLQLRGLRADRRVQVHLVHHATPVEFSALGELVLAHFGA